jgi:Domain of unknown function (DUF4277)
MVFNGMVFAYRPLMFTPQFFENLPMDLLFREGVEPGPLNRHKLGRALDAVFSYECDTLFSKIALSVCRHEGIEMR